MCISKFLIRTKRHEHIQTKMDIWRGIFFVLSNLETGVSNSFWNWFQLSITILFSLIVFCKYFVKYAPSTSAIDLPLSFQLWMFSCLYIKFLALWTWRISANVSSVYILNVHGKVKYLAPFQIHIAFVFLLKMICLSPDPDVLDHACKAKNE